MLRGGGLVAFPTDTVYGLGCYPFDEAAVERLFAAKERDRSKAIPLLLAGGEDLGAVVPSGGRVLEALVRRYWPGPLTLVVPCCDRLPAVLTAGGGSVAVRVPDHPVARDVLRGAGGVLATTSANRSGEASATTAEEVLAQLGGRVDLIIDGGRSPGGVASTVLDLTAQPPVVLRAGPLGQAELLAYWSSVAEQREDSTAVLPLEVGRHAGEAMRIALGSDHAGFNLKSEILRFLQDRGHDVVDLGVESVDDRADYPDYGRAVAEAVAGGVASLGIVVCGTGIGVSIAANRVPGVRAALCTDTYMARMSRQHNDANVLCLGQRVVGVGLGLEIVTAWLGAVFEGGRHARRVAKLDVGPADAGSSADLQTESSV